MAWVFDFGLLLLLFVSAVILIVSIWRLRSLIKQFDASQFMIKERLMKFHTTLYFLFIGAVILYTVANQYSWAIYDNDPSPSSCRVYLAKRVTLDLTLFLGGLLLVLQAYMSAKFSAPAGESRRKFLLVYQAQADLLESVRESHTENLARSQHERYRKAAIRDADLQIKLWSALTEDHSSCKLHRASKALNFNHRSDSNASRYSLQLLDDDVGSIKTHEIEILEDCQEEGEEQMDDETFFNALRQQYVQQ